MEHDFTSGSVWKKLLLFAVPIFGANLLQALYGTVDLFVVGLFADASAVSAVSTGSMMMQTITGIITGLTMGCTVLLGQNIGKKDEAAAERTVGSALWLFVTVGILLAVIVAVLAVGIASVINAPAEAFSQTTDYIRICGIGIICIVMFNAIGGMFRGLGDSCENPCFVCDEQSAWRDTVPDRICDTACYCVWNHFACFLCDLL